MLLLLLSIPVQWEEMQDILQECRKHHVSGIWAKFIHVWHLG